MPGFAVHIDRSIVQLYELAYERESGTAGYEIVLPRSRIAMEAGEQLSMLAR
ncbi:MAG TPA: hypothetical protein VLN59_02545 [Burkholderiales bacterium]|nr:hypothetical protein [Burkholderiales bacterium]